MFTQEWNAVVHYGLRKQNNNKDCGVHMLLNTYAIIENEFPVEDFKRMQLLRYWIASKVLKVKPCHHKKSKHTGTHVKPMKDELSNFSSNITNKSEIFAEKNLKQILKHIEREQFCLQKTIDSDKESVTSIESKYSEGSENLHAKYEGEINIELSSIESFLKTHFKIIVNGINDKVIKPDVVNFRLKAMNTVPTKIIKSIAEEEHLLLEKLLGSLKYKEGISTLTDFSMKQCSEVLSLKTGRFSSSTFWFCFVYLTTIWFYLEHTGEATECNHNHINMLYGKYYWNIEIHVCLSCFFLTFEELLILTVVI